jgi:hypothetical protein
MNLIPLHVLTPGEHAEIDQLLGGADCHILVRTGAAA